MTHVCDCSSEAHRTGCTGEMQSVPPHYLSCPVPPVFRCTRKRCRLGNLHRDSVWHGLQPELLLRQTPCNWALIISSCDVGGREGRWGRQRALVSLMERGERNPQPPARRKSSCSSSYGSACSCLREKGDWLACVPWGAFMFLPGQGGGDGGVLTKRRNIKPSKLLIESIHYHSHLNVIHWLYSVQWGSWTHLGSKLTFSSG